MLKDIEHLVRVQTFPTSFNPIRVEFSWELL